MKNHCYTMRTWSRFAAMLALSTLVVACGGGSDKDTAPTTPTTPIAPIIPVDPIDPDTGGTTGFLPVLAEAEGGNASSSLTRGEGMAAVTDTTNNAISYVTAAVNGTTPPEDDSRVVALEVTFAEAGIYEVYVRFRVGPGGGGDDSFYMPSALGTANTWLLVNGISGYSAPGQTGHEPATLIDEGGDGTTGVWKWTRLADLTYEVPIGELVQTFRFAGREDGLDIDKFVFSHQLIGYTAAQLEAGEAGKAIEPVVTPDPYTPPVGQLPMAAGKSKYLGSVCCGNQAVNFAAYFNQVVPENAGKWGSVEATRDVYNWGPLDAARDLALANGFPFRFHVLVWGNQQPAWIETLPQAEQLEEIQEWFNEVNARYGEDLDYIEVVNEFDNDPPNTAGSGGGNYIAALGGTGPSGYDWILNAFRMARATFPASSKLMLNEYSVINSTARTDKYIAVVELLKAENLIDAIGFQGHAFSTTGPVDQMLANMDKLAATGLPLLATELDIDGPELQQLLDYQRVFRAIWEHPAVAGVTLWGYRPGMWRTDQGATLAHENGAEKMALRWLNGYISGTAPLIQGAASVNVSAAAAPGAAVSDFATTNAGGIAHETGAEVQWAIATGSGAGLFAVNADTGEVTVATALTAGSYDLMLHVDVNGILSNMHRLQILVQ